MWNKTLFFSDIDEISRFIVLTEYSKLIEKRDVENGYILKEDLLVLVYDAINKGDINKNSYIVEYQWSEYDSSICKETIRLPIKIDKEKYWITLFFSDIDDTSEFIVLSYFNKLIEKCDVEQGYILKEDL